jgi:hypothetical protein
MTVEELIKHLAGFDPDLPVYVRGYEGNVDDVHTVVQVLVHRDEDDGSAVYGDHALYEPQPRFETPETIAADTARASSGVQMLGPEKGYPT